MKYRDRIYQKEFELTPVEGEIVASSNFQRLKFISHAGMNMDRSTHTRHEHTLGVWTLCNVVQLGVYERIASLVHDIGHMPFSHSFEKSFKGKVDHKSLTKHEVTAGETSKILEQHGIDIHKILEIIFKESDDNPINSTNGIMSLDHLDSFIRDVHYYGVNPHNIPEIIGQLSVEGGKLITNLENARKVMDLLFIDHSILFSKKAILLEYLAQKLFEEAKKIKLLKGDEYFVRDFDLLERFNSCDDPVIQRLLRQIFSLVPLLTEEEIKVEKTDKKEESDISINRIYRESIFVGNQLVEDVDEKIKKRLQELDQYLGHYKINYPPSTH
ncbi:HD domain-containing protein [Patescibacteria group bacterium]